MKLHTDGFHVAWHWQGNGGFHTIGGAIIPEAIAYRAFSRIPEKLRRFIVHIMAEIAEKAYRRGFQQGVHAAQTMPHKLPADLVSWRYETAPGLSLGFDGFKTTAVQRLYMEEYDLRGLGFYFEDLTEPCREAQWNLECLARQKIQS